MANTILLAQNYLPVMDEVYQRESLTSRLDSANEKIKFINANTIQLFKTQVDGLGDYDRNSGYVKGDVNSGWETLTLTKDRGRSFMVDSMDDEETINMAFGTLSGEFVRTKVVPEIDAYRFAKYAGTNNITVDSTDITVGTTDVPALVDAAMAKMSDDEVPEEGRLLYISETAYAGLKAKVSRTLANENGVNKEVITYNGMPVIRVPKGRFATKITLKDGTTSGQTSGGYEIPTDGTAYGINFMIIHPTAVAQVVKHQLPRIFTPAQNQDADAWKFDYRVYHDAFVEENKVAGIYVNKTQTAIS